MGLNGLCHILGTFCEAKSAKFRHVLYYRASHSVFLANLLYKTKPHYSKNYTLWIGTMWGPPVHTRYLFRKTLTPCDRWSFPVLYRPKMASKFLGDRSKKYSRLDKLYESQSSWIPETNKKITITNTNTFVNIYTYISFRLWIN